MKKHFRFLIYLSFAAFVVYLYRMDYLFVPKIHSTSFLGLSFLFLFAGFLGDAFCWKKALNKKYVEIGFFQALASSGLSILAKYLPGKFWVVFGRAVYISQGANLQVKVLSSISLSAQFISLWVGLVIGGLGLLYYNYFSVLGALTILLLFLLTIAIFTRTMHTTAEYALRKIIKKQIEIPSIRFVDTLKILPWYFLDWVLWSMAFYFLLRGIESEHVGILASLAFPLSGTVGTIAVFAPAGIGVREGVLVGYLVSAGMNPKEATTVSVVARLWFLVGEVFYFVSGLIAHKYLAGRSAGEQDLE